jgi:protein ImuA
LTFVPLLFSTSLMPSSLTLGRTGDLYSIKDRLRALQAHRALDAPESSARIPLGHPLADICLRGGLARGALHEVFAGAGHEAAATGFAVGLCRRVASGKHLLWIRQDFSAREYGELSPTGLLELGLDPARLLILHTATALESLRAASDALSCAALGAVVIEIAGSPKILDLVASRRLTLGATEKNVTAILLRFAAEPQASTAETRWLVRAARSAPNENWGKPVFEAQLMRNRHGQTGQWIMEWGSDDGFFKEPCDH